MALTKSKKSPEQSLVVVRRSPIQGRGVFARKAIAKGVRIIEYTGEREPASEIDEEHDDEAARRHHTFLFSVSSKVVIDGMRGGNASRFINHSCEANCWAIVDRGRVFIESKRAILPGEELSYDYWYTTDTSYSNADLRRIYPCHCGAKRCRGTLAALRRKPRKTAKPAKTVRAAKTAKKTLKARARR
jgi:SET domain-containing protein